MGFKKSITVKAGLKPEVTHPDAEKYRSHKDSDGKTVPAELQPLDFDLTIDYTKAFNEILAENDNDRAKAVDQFIEFLISEAASPRVITWQNSNRKLFDALKIQCGKGENQKRIEVSKIIKTVGKSDFDKMVESASKLTKEELVDALKALGYELK